MANTKGKIIIGGAIALTGFVIGRMIYKGIRRKKISTGIFNQLNDTSLAGVGQNVGANEAHKYSLAFDPDFWKKNKGNPLPTQLITDSKARQIATEIHENIGYTNDDEDAILSAIKKAKTQGQLSKVTYVYENAPFKYGNLASDLQSALSGGVIVEDRLKELNNYINSLPY